MCTPPSWNLKLMTSYAVPVENTLKYSLAPSALASNTLKLSLERRKKNRKNFRLRLRRAEKIGHFCQPTRFCPKLPPSGKIPAGAAPMAGFQTRRRPSLGLQTAYILNC